MVIIEQDFLEITKALDVEAFWAENDQCWGRHKNKPRCALEFSPDDHWLFEFLDVESTLRYFRDKAYRDELHHP
jgi:hypothetical protein